MCKKLFWMVVLACLVPVLTGCPPTTRNGKRNPPPASPSDSTPQKTFAQVNEAILKGDLQTAYDLQSSAKKAVLTFEQFQKDHLANREDWELRIKGAQLKFVSVDDGGLNASGKVIWGDGMSGVVDFVRERGIWRENNFYPIHVPSGQ